MPAVRPSLIAALAASGALLATAAEATAAAPAPTTGRLLVTTERHAQDTGRAAASALAGAGARVSGPVVPELGLTTVSPRAAGASRAALARRLRRLPGVVDVHEERRFTLRYQPNDPALTQPEAAPGTPAGTPVEWWAQREGFEHLWDLTRGAGATVAVVDTGVDATHPELAGKIARAVDLDADPGTGPATVDEVGHGTHVASLACADGDNAVGIAGAGLECKLLVYKSDLTESSVARSIVAAVRAGADAINLSFGTTGQEAASRTVVDALRLAHRRGVVVAAAAADAPTQEQGDPANVLQPTGTGPDLTRGIGLTVTAADQTGARAAFAGYGTQISLAAYGAWSAGKAATGPPGILGAFPATPTSFEAGSPPTVPPCDCRVSFDGDPRYAYIQGTSMATPLVSAAAALLKDLNPDLSADDVIRTLKSTARRPVGAGWTPDLGWGLLDPGAAGEAARLIDRTGPRSDVRVRARQPGGRRTLAVTATDPVRRPGLQASGVKRVELWRALGRGRFRRIAATDARTFSVRVPRGRRVRYATVAVDRAGNREAARPTRADLTFGT